MIRIYTDGATSSNGKADAVGGWAYLILNDNIKINKGEIILWFLQQIRKKEIQD